MGNPVGAGAPGLLPSGDDAENGTDRGCWPGQEDAEGAGAPGLLPIGDDVSNGAVRGTWGAGGSDCCPGQKARGGAGAPGQKGAEAGIGPPYAAAAWSGQCPWP